MQRKVEAQRWFQSLPEKFFSCKGNQDCKSNVSWYWNTYWGYRWHSGYSCWISTTETRFQLWTREEDLRILIVVFKIVLYCRLHQKGTGYPPGTKPIIHSYVSKSIRGKIITWKACLNNSQSQRMSSHGLSLTGVSWWRPTTFETPSQSKSIAPKLFVNEPIRDVL